MLSMSGLAQGTVHLLYSAFVNMNMCLPGHVLHIHTGVFARGMGNFVESQQKKFF